MEIVKIAKKTWRNAVICQICQKFFTVNVFYCMVLYFVMTVQLEYIDHLVAIFHYTEIMLT